MHTSIHGRKVSRIVLLFPKQLDDTIAITYTILRVARLGKEESSIYIYVGLVLYFHVIALAPPPGANENLLFVQNSALIILPRPYGCKSFKINFCIKALPHLVKPSLSSFRLDCYTVESSLFNRRKCTVEHAAHARNSPLEKLLDGNLATDVVCSKIIILPPWPPHRYRIALRSVRITLIIHGKKKAQEGEDSGGDDEIRWNSWKVEQARGPATNPLQSISFIPSTE